MRCHEVAGSGIDACRRDCWHARINGPVPAHQAQSALVAFLILSTAGTWANLHRFSRHLTISSPLVQALGSLRVVRIVAHVHVRHTGGDARLQHIALGAPLERAGCVDQQIHILQP